MTDYTSWARNMKTETDLRVVPSCQDIRGNQRRHGTTDCHRAGRCQSLQTCSQKRRCSRKIHGEIPFFWKRKTKQQVGIMFKRCLAVFLVFWVQSTRKTRRRGENNEWRHEKLGGKGGGSEFAWLYLLGVTVNESINTIIHNIPKKSLVLAMYI